MRYDKEMIPVMIEAGWTPEISQKDINAGRTDLNSMLLHPINFVKDNVHAWKNINSSTGKIYWRVADLIDGYYRNHVSLDDLNEVISYEKLNHEHQREGMYKVIAYKISKFPDRVPIKLNNFNMFKLDDGETVMNLTTDNVVVLKDGNLYHYPYQELSEEALKKIDKILN